jgi:pimeloyl-ACP methyl ester carboxylesterase
MLLAYDDEGPGPVVVLLHGFPLDRTMWALQLTGVGGPYRVIAPDLRGHGQTAAPAGIYTMDEMADDVIELLNALNLTEPVVLGGLSMGGYIALSAILRYPERFRALMLMDTRATADSAEAAKGRRELADKVESSGSVVPVIEAMLPKLFSPMTRVNRADRIARVVDVMERTTPRAVAGALRGMAARPDRTPSLGQIKVPSLVLVGVDDAITPPEEARTLASGLSTSRLAEIPDAGHLAPLENSEASNLAILSFLGSLR